MRNCRARHHRHSRFATACLLLAAMGWLLWALPLAAQTVRALDSSVRNTWTTRDGLPHSTVNAVAQTADGYLWIATWEGLVRFNGLAFELFDRAHLPGLLDNGIRSLRVAGDGSLWVGTARGGLARRDGQRWTFPAPAGGLVVALLDDRQGRMWAATEGAGLERIDADGRRQRYSLDDGLPSNSVSALAEDANGVLWVGTMGGLVRIVDDRIEPVAAGSGLPMAAVSALQLESDGGLLIGTDAGAWVLRHGSAEQLAGLPAGESVNSLLSLPFGERLIGTVRSGLYQQYAGHMAHLGAEHGLPNQRVTAIFRDRESNLWVGTNSGLVRMRDAPFATLTRFHGLSDNFVRALLLGRGGDLWIGTSRGLNRLRSADVAQLSDPVELAEESVLALAQADEHSLWVGTFANGALRLQDGVVVERWNRERGLASNEVRTLLRDRDGSLWLGTANGLHHLVAGAVVRYGREQGLPGHFVASLAQTSDGRVWAGTATGVAVIEGGALRPLDLSAMDQAEFVFGFREDSSGHLWMSTDRGLVRYRLSDGQLRHVGRAAGLPVEKAFEIIIDLDGAYWLSSNRGVTRVAPGSLDAVAEGRATQVEAVLYGEPDGMASAQCNGGAGPAAVLRDDGSVWVATALGVARVKPQSIDGPDSAPPPVAIERVRLDGRDSEMKRPIVVPTGTQRIEFEFAGLTFVTPEWVRYRTRLEGFDSDWVDRGTQRSAEFTNLPPGRYRFRVRAANPDSGWSLQDATVDLVVLARWWQQPWVWWTLAISLVLAAAAVQRWRIQQLRRNERRLSQLVEQRTADLREQASRLTALDLERSQLVELLREQAGAFERQAREDSLTGLLNRRGFDERVEQVLLSVARLPRPLCLAMIDIDHFKRVNDQWSHAVGDVVLRRVAECIRDTARGADMIARWGGEEIIVMFEGVDIAAARAACERIRSAVARLAWQDIAPALAVTISVGVVEREPGEAYERWLQRADGALYAAKEGGRNRVCG